jgi:hypothetical protein
LLRFFFLLDGTLADLLDEVRRPHDLNQEIIVVFLLHVLASEAMDIYGLAQVEDVVGFVRLDDISAECWWDEHAFEC